MKPAFNGLRKGTKVLTLKMRANRSPGPLSHARAAARHAAPGVPSPRHYTGAQHPDPLHDSYIGIRYATFAQTRMRQFVGQREHLCSLSVRAHSRPHSVAPFPSAHGECPVRSCRSYDLPVLVEQIKAHHIDDQSFAGTRHTGAHRLAIYLGI